MASHLSGAQEIVATLVAAVGFSVLTWLAAPLTTRYGNSPWVGLLVFEATSVVGGGLGGLAVALPGVCGLWAPDYHGLLVQLVYGRETKHWLVVFSSAALTGAVLAALAAKPRRSLVMAFASVLFVLAATGMFEHAAVAAFQSLAGWLLQQYSGRAVALTSVLPTDFLPVLCLVGGGNLLGVMVAHAIRTRLQVTESPAIVGKQPMEA